MTCAGPVGSGRHYSKAYSLLSGEEVRQINKQQMEGVKRVNINVPIELHNSFKAASAARGENMTDVLLKRIEEYVEKYGPAAPARKGRRS